MKKGEIYFGVNNRRGRHPMVFLSDIDEYGFHGVMLTHSPKHGNIKLSPAHFGKVASNFDIDRTHVVRRSLIKKKEWEPFQKVGVLSKEGIIFIEQLIAGKEPRFW